MIGKAISHNLFVRPAPAAALALSLTLLLTAGGCASQHAAQPQARSETARMAAATLPSAHKPVPGGATASQVDQSLQ